MTRSTKSNLLKKSKRKNLAPATRRSMSGAGFDFEDLISAWFMVKMLTGEQAPVISGTGIKLQAQVDTLNWHIDDLLLTSQNSSGVCGRLAISAKGNKQVTSSGLPADFVNRAWKQWREPQSPMNRLNDGLALVTLGKHSEFHGTWMEVKNACEGSDMNFAMSRIQSTSKQSKIFDSVSKPNKKDAIATNEETIELIRRLCVLPLDLQFSHSDDVATSIAQCRQILESGDATEAEKLWVTLSTIAKNIRISRGTITLQDLWSELRTEFTLRHHPDYTRDWETLFNITSDYKARIETKLPSGYSVPQAEEKSKIKDAITENVLTVIHGESGTGKSALIKNVLNTQFEKYTQVWFSPDVLETALSAAHRNTLPLGHDLEQVLNATINPNNILIIDSAERIKPEDFCVIKQILQTVCPPTEKVNDSSWRVILIMQTQSWVEATAAKLSSRHPSSIELKHLDNSDVKLALLHSPSLSWLTGHDETIAALTNLRILSWIVQAGATLNSDTNRLTSHTSIADHLWDYWTDGRLDIKRILMNLAKREAFFERSFSLSDLDSGDVTSLTPWPKKLPLLQNPLTTRIEFEHDLAADWARFQYLRQIYNDTTQWVELAENPLWTNALRMLGQFLLRLQVENKTEWDVAFESAIEAKQSLVKNILLDSLCLDPEAERFLSERTDLLISNDAQLLNNLLIRFHHIGTVPINGIRGTASSLDLYMETQFRSVVIGRWPPVLKFIISQQEKLCTLVSSALAKVIHTWLTGTPHKLENGTLVPFRRELAELALTMARTVQVKKGHGVIFLTREPLLYRAPLSGASDLPNEIGDWSLELAGRKEVTEDVNVRIDEVRLQEAKQRAERLRTDPVYKAQHEARHNISPIIGLGREKLPPWPLGAHRRVDMDFRQSCFKENALLPLMQACPDVAAEVLLALIIEDQPERKYSSNRYEIELGLDFARDGYPTAFWKSPFLAFLQVAPDIALNALIALVNFCTERWVAEMMDGREGSAPGLTLQLSKDKEKTFNGGYQVFDWTQTNSMHYGNLFSALDALEKWFTLQIDTGVDITPYIDRVLSEGTSAALIGLLINIGKYNPSLFSGMLSPMLTNPHVYFWDSRRVEQVEQNFVDWHGMKGGEVMSELTQNWALAPHRQKMLLNVTVDLLHTDAVVSERLKELITKWSLPENSKMALEYKLLFASLDRDNYQPAINPETGAEVLVYTCPDNLLLETNSWQDENNKSLQYLLLPENCETLLQAQQAINDDDATYLYKLLKECTVNIAGGENNKAKCRIALAATLIVLAESWLTNTPEAKEKTLSIIRTAIGEAASTIEEIRNIQIGQLHSDLKFAAYAIMHFWVANDDPTLEWEASVLRLLTSGDPGALNTITSIAYANRKQLGSSWWRLLQAGVMRSGLSLLAPHYGDSKDVERVWGVWLTRLRSFSLRGKSAAIDDLNIERITTGCERLDFYRRMRAYESGDKQWQGKPERQTGMGLDGHFLGLLFHWLINGPGSGDRPLDTKLIGQLWAYESKRAKAREKEDYGEYDLPSHNLGYDLLEKLAELSLTVPKIEARALWEPVLIHGPEAHYALEHFIRCLFMCLSNGADSVAFERVWREIAEYGLTAKWDKPGLWFYGERLICDLLGYGNENSLQKLPSGTALRMCDVYKRWAESHLGRDEECITRFCNFLTTEFGASLRFDGLHWIATFFKENNPRSYWRRNGTGDALIELINISLNQNTQALTNDKQARQALVEISAMLVARNIPTALALQERIKRLR